MIEETEFLQRKTLEIRTILERFKQIYKNRFTPEEVTEIFQNSCDELFPKSKTAMTEHDVESLYDHFKVAANKHQIAMVSFNSLVGITNNSIIQL